MTKRFEAPASSRSEASSTRSAAPAAAARGLHSRRRCEPQDGKQEQERHNDQETTRQSGLVRLAVPIMALLFVSTMAGCIKDAPEHHQEDSPQPVPPPESTKEPAPPVAEPPAPAPLPPPSDAPDNNIVVLSLFEPHVVVAVPDSGINPYHEIFRRPNRTMHPCKYIEDYPCDVPALRLSIGRHDSYRKAVLADLEVWQDVKPGDWYWIPGTSIIAIGCDSARTGASHTDGVAEGLCGLDENDDHGTGIASSILMENPDALLVVYESHAQGHTGLDESGIPIDIYSHSNGFNGPSPYVGPLGPMLEPFNGIYVRAAGNQPDTTFDKYTRARPDVIAVGGAFPADRTVPALTTKTMDVASYFSRPGASSSSLTAYREDFEGTSLAAPTVAGALSKVILGVRQASGYTGSIEDGMIDPVLGISYADLRDAMNATADYHAEAKYPNTWQTSGNYFGYPVPIVEEAPWLQLGWGIYDGNVADTTLSVLLDQAEAPEKPDEARAYQEAQYELRQALYG